MKPIIISIVRNKTNLIVKIALLLASALVPSLLPAQSVDLQQRVTDLKDSTAKNKQALAQYTWIEHVTISVKGQERKQERFQVRLGPDGKPQKTPLDPASAASDAPKGGRLRQRIVERKKEEYEDYADRIKSLTQRYIPPDKDAIQDAYSKGNISINPGGEQPSQVKLVIRNYVKPQDQMTLVLDKAEKRLVSIQIASYLDDPQDAVNLAVQFGHLPDGTNHVSGVTVDGVSKQLTVVTQNSDYRKL
jgi:hypothetical protein